MKGLVRRLAKIILKKLKKKFVLCGIYSGGIVLGKELVKELKKNKVKTRLFYIRLKKSKEYGVMGTNLPKKLSDIVIVFLDDAIWTGRTKFAVEKYISKRFKGVDYKFVTLLDCAGYADYSLY